MSGLREKVFGSALVAVIALSAGADVTTSVSCVTTNAAIPEGAVPVSVFVMPDVPDGAIVVDARVELEVDHPWVGDLRVELVHVSSGTTVILMDRPGFPSSGFPGPYGCGGNDIDATFADSAVAAAETICSVTIEPVIAGPVTPLNALTVLDGLPAHGTWEVRVIDTTAYDAGTFVGACLELDVVPDCNANGVDDSIDITQGGSADVNGDGVPDECTCGVDLTGDCVVSVADVLALLSMWGPCGAPCPGDLDGDGSVGASDLLALLAAWSA